MGYFSNGTEGDGFFENHCANCIHEEPGCVVWAAHLLHNYDQFPEHAKTEFEGGAAQALREILDMLIPRVNGRQVCKMEAPK